MKPYCAERGHRRSTSRPGFPPHRQPMPTCKCPLASGRSSALQSTTRTTPTPILRGTCGGTPRHGLARRQRRGCLVDGRLHLGHRPLSKADLEPRHRRREGWGHDQSHVGVLSRTARRVWSCRRCGELLATARRHQRRQASSSTVRWRPRCHGWLRLPQHGAHPTRRRCHPLSNCRR